MLIIAQWMRFLLLLGVLVTGVQLGAMDAPAAAASEGLQTYGRFNTESCAVCLDSLHASGALRTLPCGHVLHNRCYEEWLRSPACREGVITCPLCRTADPFAHAVEHLYLHGENWKTYFQNCLLADPGILQYSDGCGNTLLQYALDAALTVKSNEYFMHAENDLVLAALIQIILDMLRDERTQVTKGVPLAPLLIVRPIARSLRQDFDLSAVSSPLDGDDELGVLKSPKALAHRLGDQRVIDALEHRLAPDEPLPVAMDVVGLQWFADDASPTTPRGESSGSSCPGAPQKQRTYDDDDDRN